MFKTLRNRLILSHVLPLLVIIPLMGVAIVYVLETQFLLPSLSRELIGEAELAAAVLGNQPRVWEEPSYAQAILRQVGDGMPARVMLIKTDGRLLASTDENDANRVDQPIDVEGLDRAADGELVSRIEYSRRLRGEAIDVLVPVNGPDERPLGLIRLTYRYASVADRLIQLRYVIGTILIVGLVAGSALGYSLALGISTPMLRVAEAIYDLAHGNRREPLAEQGPEEIRLQLRAVNFLVERLQGLEEARRQLLANLVHELGRPLGALRTGLQALMQGADKDPGLYRDLMVGMDHEMVTLQRLLDDLAHLHGQVLGPLELDRQPIDLSQWLPSFLRTWQKAAESKNQELIADIPGTLGTIEVDSTRLSQALGNLVSNACKYTPESGTITVTAGEENDQVWIRVADTGPGISEQEQEQVFEPFFRGGQGRRIKQGMGLGLSITRDVVIAHGGQIDLESTAGQGATFTIWLPKQAPSLVASS